MTREHVAAETAREDHEQQDAQHHADHADPRRQRAELQRQVPTDGRAQARGGQALRRMRVAPRPGDLLVRRVELEQQ